MIDQYGRNIDYLRISVTDRCNLRCVYCMPEEGVQLIKHNDILTYDEIIRTCRIFAGLGVSKIKLTGGEPLVRKNLEVLLKDIKNIEGIEEVTLTTNGVLLKEHIESLAEAGLDAVNISLDTLSKEQYACVTRRDKLDEALEGMYEALKYKDVRVKVNCVIIPGQNDDEWIRIAALSKDFAVDVRFIEMMPIGIGKSNPKGTQDLVFDKLEKEYGKGEFLDGKFGNGPAVYVKFPNFTGKIGFISAISHEFCGDCNRVRLTADGFLKLCLQYANGCDLKALLRSDKTDEEISSIIRETIYNKPRCHQFVNSDNEGKTEGNGCLEKRRMSSIGG